MNLAFSTMSCPAWDIDTMVAYGKKLGFGGVDIRCYLGNNDFYDDPAFTTGAAQTARQFADAGLAIPCLSSSVRLIRQTPIDIDHDQREIDELIRLSQVFGTPAIRVFPGEFPGLEVPAAIDAAMTGLTRVVPKVKAAGLKLQIETHDDWTNTQLMRQLLERADQEFGHGLVKVTWDTHHTWRYAHETPTDSFARLQPWLDYVHWKDSYLDPKARRGYQYCQFGKGDIPLVQTYELLVKGDYNGWVAFEWEKSLRPDLAEPEQALPDFMAHMAGLAKGI